jgi:hypothetical protein
MQEKIGHARDEDIYIYKRKPPATSWVKENIVRYYNIKVEKDLLVDLLAYTQQLQAAQLTKAKPHFELRESYVPVPEKGSAENISTTVGYNTLQSYLKTETEYLEDMLQILKQGNPKLSAECDQFLAQLKQIGQAFPNLSGEQLQNLSNIMTQLLAHVKELPFSDRREFWDTLLIMMQNLMHSNDANIKDFKDEMNELQARSQMLLAVEELLQKIQHALRATPPSEKEMHDLVESLQELANKATLLDADQKQALVSFFQQLSQFKNSKGENLSQILTDFLIQTKLRDFLASHPKASPEQVLAYLKEFLKQSNLQSSNLPFMKEFGDLIEKILNKKGFPACSGFSGMEFASVQQSKTLHNEKLLSQLIAAFASDPDSLKKLQHFASHFSTVASEEGENNSVKIEGYRDIVDQLGMLQTQFGRSALWTVGQSLLTGEPPKGWQTPSGEEAPPPPGPTPTGEEEPPPPAEQPPPPAEQPPQVTAGQPPSSGKQKKRALASQFADVVGQVMTQEEQYLRILSITLFLNNYGAEFGNKLLNDILGFNSAANTFSFSNSLHNADGKFSGSYASAKNQLDNEKDACDRSIGQVKQALSDIQDQLDSIDTQLLNPNLTDDQVQLLLGMQSSLQDLQTNLYASLGQLTDLQGFLTGINVVSVGDDDKYFNVTGPQGWQTQLNQYENVVINGDTKSTPPGGLLKVQGLASAFQQGYQDKTGESQINVQKEMMKYQQVMAIISTSMEALNHAAMTFFQNINK